MSRLVSDITLDQVDEWFKIGQTVYKDVHTLPRSTTSGRYFDPETQQPYAINDEPYVPHYQRHPRDESQQDYATEYQAQEEEHLMHSAQPQLHGMQEVSDRMSEIDLESICTSAVAMPEDLVPSNAMDVYKNYRFQHRYEESLPITRHHEQVIATIECNQVTVIQGSTGSGKTTQVPQYILDHYAQMNKYCNIVVTQPRRIAAMSIARRVCSERDWQLGTVCGYQVGLDKVTSEDTRILYCTTGTLLRKLITTKNMLQFTHVILDEVHDRDQDTDFSLLVVKKLLRTNSPHVKVILMSATIESEVFAQYFALPVGRHLEPAPVVSVEGKIYNVNEYYTEDLSPLGLGEVPPLDVNNPMVSEEAMAMAVRLIQEFDKLEAKGQKSVDAKTGFTKMRGTVLVFLPGLAEIDNLFKLLKEQCHMYALKLIPLHSTITMEEQALVFDIPEEGQRKVILSTNIAESSITVPDIKYVIDFCLTKNLVSDTETNYTSLQLEWASRANCTQRKGRAGRVSNGRVYRMITRYFWDNYIPEYGIPEMQRCPLQSLILQVKLLDLGEPKAILALALSPPNLDDIEKTILLLKEVGALATPLRESRNRHDGQLTFVGRVLAQLPLDISIGKMIILGHVFGLLEECLIIGAALSLKSVFASPYKKQLESYRSKVDWARGSNSDCIAILNAYREWEKKRNMGQFKRRSQKEREWANLHMLQIRRLYDVSELVKELEKRLYDVNIQKPQRPPNYRRHYTEDQEMLLLKVVIAGAFYPNFFLKEPVDEQESLKVMSGHDPFNTVMVKGLPANQGTIYKQAMEDLFRNVGNQPTAYFEETKAYITFQWKKEYKGKVHPGVFSAIKLRQLRIPLEVKLLSKEETRAFLQEQEKKHLQNSSHRLRTNRITVTDSTQDGSTVSNKMILPPPVLSAVILIVTEVVDCGHFWAQYAEQQNFDALLHIQSTLNRYSGQTLKPLVGENRAEVGTLCAAPFEDETVEYYRAQIVGFRDRQWDPRIMKWKTECEVFYVDYGNTSYRYREELRQLPDELCKIPFQAVECYLSEIRPSIIRCPDGRWTEEAVDLFRNMVAGNKRLYGNVYSVVRDVLRLELIEAFPNGRQVCFNHELILQGFADRAEESYLSKQNHELRQNNVLGVARTRRPEEMSLENKNQTDWLKVRSNNLLPTAPPNSRGGKVFLKGPSNPHEMSFISMTNVGRLRTAKIDPGSVNCVAIDDEPQDPHDRLMVSSFVGLNPTGSSMQARDTTILPQIPGIPALLALLFAPVAELRTDPGVTKRIGAICGLGTERNSDYPAFPDHDMEVIFDTKIDREDILKINGVRMAINMAVGDQDKVMSWGPDAIYKIQKSSRRKIMELFQKRREHMNPVSFSRPYLWNQLDEDDILNHNLEGTEADCPQLLNLHNDVSVIEEADEVEETEDDNPRTRYLKQHVKFLREAARNYTTRDPITCELCNVTAQTPQILASHLDLNRHKRREEALFADD